MFVISLSNLLVTDQGLGGGSLTGATVLTWETIEEAMAEATILNAIHGLNAYILREDRTDCCVEMVGTYNFGYANA